jgi:single-stranded-DNA-specific exonuclease
VNLKYKSLPKNTKKFLNKREVKSQKTLDRFLAPNFENLRPADDTLKEVVQKTKEAIKQEKKLLIWGDEDVDGVTSTLIMKLLFKKIFGIEVKHYVPDRRKEGYSLSKKGIDKAYKKGINLILTVDSGTNSLSEIEYLKKKGMDIIITDHHEVKEKLPKKISILNPKIHSFGYKYLCGAGVAFKFADRMLSEHYNKTTREWSKDLPEIPIYAFIGTILDKVPLLDENRIILKEGLKHLKESNKPSFSLLATKRNIQKALIPLASGVKKLTWDFFSANSMAEAEDIYEQLRTKNSLWNKKARGEFTSIKEELNKGNLVIFRKNLDYRVASSVANRAKDYTNLPVFIIYTLDSEIRGDGRGPKGFDLIAVLDKVKDLMIEYGGHKCACGFKLKKDKLEEFKERTEPALKRYRERKPYDSELELKEITPDLKDLINEIEPFGYGNPPPIFLIKNIDYIKKGKGYFLKNGKIKLLLDKTKEMPPPSKKVDAYLEIKNGKTILKRWEWTKD